jgi:hypothetical protein
MMPSTILARPLVISLKFSQAFIRYMKRTRTERMYKQTLSISVKSRGILPQGIGHGGPGQDLKENSFSISSYPGKKVTNIHPTQICSKDISEVVHLLSSYVVMEQIGHNQEHCEPLAVLNIWLYEISE